MNLNTKQRKQKKEIIMTDEIAELLGDEQKMTTEQMQEFIQAQNRLRAEQCTAEIQKILDEHKCRINSYPVIIDGLIRATTEIVAL